MDGHTDGFANKNHGLDQGLEASLALYIRGCGYGSDADVFKVFNGACQALEIGVPGLDLAADMLDYIDMILCENRNELGEALEEQKIYVL